MNKNRCLVLFLLVVVFWISSAHAFAQCTTNNDCGAGYYCQKDPGYCSTVNTGTCAAIPTVCPTDNIPVCGCNGLTYPNVCNAAMKGLNVSSTARCAGACLDDDYDGYCNPFDCDSTDYTTNTGAVEINDLKDNNCNGLIDEGLSNPFPRYRLIQLGDLPGGTISGESADINDQGWIVGSSNSANNSGITYSDREAFVWNPNTGTITGLGFGPGASAPFISSARAINQSNQIAGVANGKVGVWQSDGGFVTAPAVGQPADAMDINDSGMVVGSGVNSDNNHSCYLWDLNLEALSYQRQTDSTGCHAMGINNNGLITGYSDYSLPISHQEAFTWDSRSQNGIIGLGYVTGGTYATSASFDININGQVTGYSTAGTGDLTAMTWASETGMEAVYTLPTGSEGQGINAQGVVVGGHGYVFGVGMSLLLDSGGFIFSKENGMVDLVLLVDESRGPWRHLDVAKINDLGQIAGTASGAAGQMAVLLDPVEEICNNARDDDGNGHTDCADPDCKFDHICHPCPDADGDGFSTTGLCGPTPVPDCDDSSPAIYPEAPEICDGLDNDCDGSVDEVKFYYRDFDVDGYGDKSSANWVSCSQLPPAGYVANNTDCNDAKAAFHPGAPEVCDGLDNDCDVLIDEAGITYYLDADKDGSGNALISTQACAAPFGYVSDNLDCNDSAAGIHPGAAELCNDSLDNDCDGQVNEGCSIVTVLAPNGGETFDRSETPKVTISWSTNVTSKPVTKTTISYSTNGGSNWTRIKDLAGNPGTYLWALPAKYGNAYRVKVEMFNNKTSLGSDSSDENFEVVR